MHDELKDFFENLNRLHTQQQELAAIMMTKRVVTSVGRTLRLATGDLIRVEDGQIVDIEEGKPATHKIVMCLGTLYNNFEFILTELSTNQPTNLKV